MLTRYVTVTVKFTDLPIRGTPCNNMFSPLYTGIIDFHLFYLGTNMVDFTIDVYHQLHPDTEPPEALGEKRREVVQQLNTLQEKSGEVFPYYLF